MRPILRLAGRVTGAVVLAHAVPSVLTIPVVHRRLAPRLTGHSTRRHVALTFDDGPDPASTPAFLEALADLDVRATFFLLGAQASRAPQLARTLATRGHEIAVHGETHRPHLLQAPWTVARDLDRARSTIARVSGDTPRWWRPPNGIVTGGGLAAARRLGLRPVLWSADGQDWSATATPESVAARICARLRPGDTVLLHDSDITSAAGSWHAALGALPAIVAHCRRQGWAIGPLREHW